MIVAQIDDVLQGLRETGHRRRADAVVPILISAPGAQDVERGMGAIVLNIGRPHPNVVPLVNVHASGLVGCEGAQEPILGGLDHGLVLGHQRGVVA